MIQNHIHLDLTIGAAPENSPVLKWIVVFPFRTESANVFLSIERSLDGSAHLHVINNSGTPILKRDYTYRLRLTSDEYGTAEEQKELLFALLGKTVFLVDHFHANDGANHASSVKNMHFVQISPVGGVTELMTPILSQYLLDISLVEA